MKPFSTLVLYLFFAVWQNHLLAQANFVISPDDTLYAASLKKIERNRNPYKVMEVLSQIGNIEDCKNDSLRADLYYFYGSAFGQLGKFDSSHYFLSRALVISSTRNLPVNHVGTLIAQGNVYWGMQFYHLALEKYQAALELTEKNDGEEFYTFHVMILGNIGGIYAQLGEHDKALDYVIRSNRIGVKTNNLRPRSHLKIGRYLLDVNRPSEALDSLHQSIKLIQLHNDSVALAHCYEYMSTAHLKLSNYDSAEYYLLLSEKVGLLLNYNLDQLPINKGNLALKKGSVAQAKAHYLLGLEQYLEQGKLEEQAETYMLLSQLAKQTQADALALSYYEQYKQLTDSINSKERSIRVHELQTKFDVKKKEDQIARLTMKQELSEAQLSEARWQIIMVSSGAAFVVILAVVFFIFYKKKQRADQMAQHLQYEALQKRYLELVNGPTTFDLHLQLDELNQRLVNPLTEREYEVLQLSLTGMTNKQIADKIFVSVSTIKFHLGNVYNKFGVNNKNEALEYVVKTS
ncbi:MAG: LuxR C-terminal-related transcriptional regulator [Reichenbachiella sp.]|uniref:LuxR C-terminal-related transcriptional regulator n=1 Tax=Reichenbachiella sp. TaxID=2184521 RepID=UPI0032664F5A